MTTSVLHSCQEFYRRAWEERSSFCGSPIGTLMAIIVLLVLVLLAVAIAAAAAVVAVAVAVTAAVLLLVLVLVVNSCDMKPPSGREA